MGRSISARLGWIDWRWDNIVFLLMQPAAIIGLFFVPITWGGVALCLGMHFFRMFFITAGYHRYFAHRSYKTSRWFQFLLAFFAQMSSQKGTLWWAAHHRQHHRFSDKEGDVHSPRRQGFWWAHMGWIIARENRDTRHDLIKDFAQYPELRWINKYQYLPVVVLGTTLFLLGGWWAFYWGLIASTVLLWNSTFSVNSVTHVWGKQRYPTKDDSRNNPLVAFLTMGEGWHNNHHHYQSSARQGFFWWEYDVTYYLLKALSWSGLVWDIRQPPQRLLQMNAAQASMRYIEADKQA